MKKTISILAALMAVMLLASCATAFTKGGGDYRDGKKALKNKKYAEAIEKTLDALDANPEFEEAKDQLKEAFKKGNGLYMGKIEEARASNDQFANETIWPAYDELNKIHKAMAKGGNEASGFDVKDYTAQAEEAKAAAIETRYTAGVTLLEKGNAESAKASVEHFMKVTEWDNAYKEVQNMLKEAPYVAACALLAQGDIKSIRAAYIEFKALDESYKDVSAKKSEAYDLSVTNVVIYSKNSYTNFDKNINTYISKASEFIDSTYEGEARSAQDALKKARKLGVDQVLFAEMNAKFKETPFKKTNTALPDATNAVCSKGEILKSEYSQNIKGSYALIDVKTGKSLTEGKISETRKKEFTITFIFPDTQNGGNDIVTGQKGDANDGYLVNAYFDTLKVLNKFDNPKRTGEWDLKDNFRPEEYNGKTFIVSATMIEFPNEPAGMAGYNRHLVLKKFKEFQSLPTAEYGPAIQEDSYNYKESSTSFYEYMSLLGMGIYEESTVKKAGYPLLRSYTYELSQKLVKFM